ISDKVTLTVAPTVTEEDEEEVLIPSQPVSPSTDAALIESIRVSIDKLDDVLNSSSEIFINRIRIQSEVDGLHRSVEQLKHVIENLSELEQQALNERGSRATRQMRTELLEIMTRTSVKLPAILHDEISNCFRRSLDGVINNIDFPGFEELALTTLSVEEIKLVLQSSLKELEQLSSRLLKGAMSFRMVPLSSLFGRYPAEVRQMARQTNKNVQLEISGEDTEIDKMLINQLADPLMHLLRNSVDHGIEATEIRRQKGKPDIGRIQLRAYYEGSHVVVEIQDDGKGFETAKVLQRAISAGLVDVGTADELSETEILDFIFEPGFSTAEQISKLSGRGVGMDVVRSALTQIQGTIQVTNHVDGGAIVTMKLPLTLAVVRILLLEENFHQFGFPILQVNEVVAVKKEEILHVGQRLAWNYRGQTLPVTTLSSILNFQPSRFIEQELPLLILHEGERQIGVLADKVLGMQDVLIKNFGTYIKKVPFMMGCTILSDSRLVSILNPIDVVNFGDAATVKSFSEAVSEAHKARVDHTVLVIDDSKIQRTKLSS
ncbi:MAG: chemotaxis protein CheW, partial [Bdellovibrionales bacterium]|nr:chemotaxis protein CheW [Bdellovibrionales bacterium]